MSWCIMIPSVPKLCNINKTTRQKKNRWGLDTANPAAENYLFLQNIILEELRMQL